jgi:hypothetical protein
MKMSMIFPVDQFLKQREPFDVPQEQLTIARHFNAGFNHNRSRVPQGRQKTVLHAFCRPCGTYSGVVSYPALKRRAIFGKSLRDFVAILVVLTFFTLMATAETTNSLSDAELQGRALAQKILAQRPANNSTNTGTLDIQGENGPRKKLPVTCETIAGETNWQTRYEAKVGQPPNVTKLTVTHSGAEINRYAFFNYDEYFIFDNGKKDGMETYGDWPFAGSDFWLCDLGLEFFHWPEQKVLKKEFHRQCACTVLESTNPNPSTNSYSRVVCWIDQDSLGIVEAYAYDAKGNKIKNFYPKNFEKVNGQYQLESMVMENLQTGSKSVMEFDLDK